MYGIHLPWDLPPDDNGDIALMEMARAALVPEIDWDGYYTRRIQDDLEHPEHLHIPDIQHFEDSGLNGDGWTIGFWVAAGPPGRMYGVPEMPKTLRFHDIAPYSERIQECRRRWKRFEKFARGESIDLGKPELHIIKTEVA